MLAQQTVVHYSGKWEWNFKATPKTKNMVVAIVHESVRYIYQKHPAKITFEEINILWLLILVKKYINGF